MRKICCMLLAGLLWLAPAGASAAESVRVGGVDLTAGGYYADGAVTAAEPADWQAHFDPATDTLTLRGLSLTEGSGLYVRGTEATVQLVLMEANSVRATAGDPALWFDNTAVLVRGNGSLLAVGGAGADGLVCAGDLTVRGGSLDLRGGEGQEQSCGLTVLGSLQMQGGMLHALGGAVRSAAGVSCGIAAGQASFADGITIARAGPVGGVYDSARRLAVYATAAPETAGSQCAGAVGYAPAFGALDGARAIAAADGYSLGSDGTVASGLVLVPAGWALRDKGQISGSDLIGENTACVSATPFVLVAPMNGYICPDSGVTLLTVSLYEGEGASYGLCSVEGLSLDGDGRIVAVAGLSDSSYGIFADYVDNFGARIETIGAQGSGFGVYSRSAIRLYDGLLLARGTAAACNVEPKLKPADGFVKFSDGGGCLAVARSYPVWIAGRQVTGFNRENVLAADTATVCYYPGMDDGAQRLILTDAAITTEQLWAIRGKGPLSMELRGDNRAISSASSATATTAGVYLLDGGLTLLGDGRLLAQGGSGSRSYGVYAGGVSLADSSALAAQGDTAALSVPLLLNDVPDLPYTVLAGSSAATATAFTLPYDDSVFTGHRYLSVAPAGQE